MERGKTLKQEYIDVHCHILPGLDDGSQSMEMTEKMLRMEIEQGAVGLIATPHYWKGRWEAPPEKILSLVEKVEALARTMRPDFTVAAGNEIKYYGSGMIDALSEKGCLSLGNTKYVLLEFSYECSFSDIDMAVNRTKTKGFRPVLAHVERYKCLHKDYDRMDQLIQRGAYIQVNADSLAGEEGLRTSMFVRKLLQYDMIHLIGTDAHNGTNRAPGMEKCAAYIRKKCGDAAARYLLYENPLKLLNNEYL